MKENTLCAFQRAAEAGVWGIELDLRFTADLEPIVFHDANLFRLYGRYQNICELSHGEIKSSFPDIPSLYDVIERFGSKIHLMIEVKQQQWPDPVQQVSRLKKILHGLVPGKDFHFLCLHPEALEPLGQYAQNAWLAISEYWPALRSRWVKHRRWGGLCGHYLLIGNDTIKSLHRNGQKVGTGYVQSRNCLFREINRGVDWIFSNDAVHLQSIVDDCLNGRTNG